VTLGFYSVTLEVYSMIIELVHRVLELFSVERYAFLKRHLSTKHPNDRIAYTNGKAEFVVSITERAIRHYGTAGREQPIRTALGHSPKTESHHLASALKQGDVL
jgi:hypothetical protein